MRQGGGSCHDRNRHNRRNLQNDCVFVKHFVGQAKEGQGAPPNRQTCPNRHEGYPPKTPLIPTS